MEERLKREGEECCARRVRQGIRRTKEKGVAGRVSEVNKVSMGGPFSRHPKSGEASATTIRVSWYCQTNRPSVNGGLG